MFNNFPPPRPPVLQFYLEPTCSIKVRKFIQPEHQRGSCGRDERKIPFGDQIDFTEVHLAWAFALKN